MLYTQPDGMDEAVLGTDALACLAGSLYESAYVRAKLLGTWWCTDVLTRVFQAEQKRSSHRV